MWQIVYSVLSLGVSCQFVNSASRRHVLQLQIFCLFCCCMWTTSFLVVWFPFFCFFAWYLHWTFLHTWTHDMRIWKMFQQDECNIVVFFFFSLVVHSFVPRWMGKIRKHIRVEIHGALPEGLIFTFHFKWIIREHQRRTELGTECKFSCNCFYFCSFLFFNRLAMLCNNEICPMDRWVLSASKEWENSIKSQAATK